MQTKMGAVAAGAGGFIDITSTAKNVVFCSTFTGGQIKVEFDECGIKNTPGRPVQETGKEGSADIL